MGVFDDEFVTQLSQQIAEKINWRLTANVHGVSTGLSESCTHDQFYTYSTKRYGIGYDSLDIECIIDEDGSAVIRREVVATAYSEVDTLYTYLLTAEESPSGKKRNLQHGNLKSLTESKSVTWKANKKRRDDRLSGEIIIFPPLSVGESITYEMRENLPKKLFAINLSKIELGKRETPWDYINWNIIRPTRKLSLRVYFPEYAKPKYVNAEVRYSTPAGLSIGNLQHEERKLLHDQVKEETGGGQSVLKLEIDYPMPGLVYEIRWLPLAAEDISIPVTDEQPHRTQSELEYLSDLRQIISTRFNEGELQTLCFDLGVDYDSLPGQGVLDKARELIAYQKRRKQIPILVELGERLRPDISWPKQIE